MKVSEDTFGYAEAIKSSMRLNPKWIMLSEARSKEVKYLLESWSTGVRGMTTLHTDDVRNAIRDFKLEENGTLYLTSIDITVPASTDFSKILEDYREKFKNVHTLLNCLEQYKKALPGKDLSLVREMVMLFIDTLHKQETAKAENLFSMKNDEEAENE